MMMQENMNDDEDERHHKHLDADGLEQGAPVDAYIYNDDTPFPRELLPYKLPTRESNQVQKKKEAFARMFKAAPGSSAKNGAFKDKGGLIGKALDDTTTHIQTSGSRTSSEIFDTMSKSYDEQLVQPLGQVAANAADYLKDKTGKVKAKVDEYASRAKKI